MPKDRLKSLPATVARTNQVLILPHNDLDPDLAAETAALLLRKVGPGNIFP